jgi:hypothetical protein
MSLTDFGNSVHRLSGPNDDVTIITWMNPNSTTNNKIHNPLLLDGYGSK